MSKKMFISNKQAFTLLLLANISTSVLFVPGEPVGIVGQDAWLAVLIATVLAALLVFYPLGDLGSRYPGKTIIEYSQKIAGKFLGKLIGALLILMFFQIHNNTIQEFSALAGTFMPETPTLVFAIILSAITAYAVYHGIEVIGRSGEFVFPVGLFSLLLVTATILPDLNFSGLLPVMQSRYLPLLRATIAPLDWLATGFVFAILTSFLKERGKIKKLGLTAAATAGITLTIFTMINIMVFGSTFLDTANFPLLLLAEYSKVAFIERIESLVVVLWVSWIVIRGALFSYATVLGLAQLTNITDYRLLIIPETILATAYSIYQYKSFVEMSYLFKVAHLYYLFFTLAIPLTLWIISLIGRPKN